MSAQRNDKPVSSPSQPHTGLPPRFVPATACFCSQQTVTALGQNLPVLTVVQSRLGLLGPSGLESSGVQRGHELQEGFVAPRQLTLR